MAPAGSKRQSPTGQPSSVGLRPTPSPRGRRGWDTSPIGARARVRVFFFGLGYCARRLIQREPWIEASGTARTAEAVAALRREGDRSLSVRRGRRGPWAGAGARQGRGDRRLDPAARWRQGATLDRFGAAIAAAPGAAAHRLSIRPSAFMATTAAPGSTRPARRGRARRADWRGSRTRRAGRRRPGRGGPKRTSCASPASMGPAATRSSICAAARRGGSSSRARCSTAPMSMISLRYRASCSRAALRARSGTSPMTSRRRRRT